MSNTEHQLRTHTSKMVVLLVICYLDGLSASFENTEITKSVLAKQSSWKTKIFVCENEVLVRGEVREKSVKEYNRAKTVLR